MAPPDDTHKTARLTVWMTDRFPYLVPHSAFAEYFLRVCATLWILHTLYAYLDRSLVGVNSSFPRIDVAPNSL